MSTHPKQPERQQGILKKIKLYLETCRIGDLMVDKGIISADDLTAALKLQRETRKQLGQIFIDNAVLSQRDLTVMLWKQRMLRTTATALLCFMSLTAVSKKARADTIKDVPAAIQLANVSTEFARVGVYPAIYGTQEKKSGNLQAFTKWSDMFSRFDRQLKDQASNALLREWQQNLQSLKGQSIEAMANKVNDLVNEKRYVTDNKNWGKSDYWATPVEFLQRGGDCEDFAIMKYTALRSLGVPEERMRVAIVQDLQKNIPHAVLIVYAENGSFLLDNQNKRMLSAETGSRYKPIYSINRTAWWLHSAPTGGTILASAQ